MFTTRGGGSLVVTSFGVNLPVFLQFMMFAEVLI